MLLVVEFRFQHFLRMRENEVVGTPLDGVTVVLSAPLRGNWCSMQAFAPGSSEVFHRIHVRPEDRTNLDNMFIHLFAGVLQRIEERQSVATP
jgi:hypothetical protein